jgi:hypothetical protein
VNETVFRTLESWSARPALVGMLGEGGYQLLGLAFFLLMGVVLFAVARKPQAPVD